MCCVWCQGHGNGNRYEKFGVSITSQRCELWVAAGQCTVRRKRAQSGMAIKLDMMIGHQYNPRRQEAICGFMAGISRKYFVNGLCYKEDSLLGECWHV